MGQTTPTIVATASVTLSFIVDIKSVTRYYCLAEDTPQAPTTNPPENWTAVEPSYTTGSTESLFFTDCTVFTNGTFKYSEISKSSSYEAVKNVENRIVEAETKIEQNKEQISLKATKTEVTTAINNIQIGGRNLIRNSIDLLYQNYYFTEEIVVTHDEAGNLTWVSPNVMVMNDGSGNITIVASDDGNGNVILSLE